MSQLPQNLHIPNWPDSSEKAAGYESQQSHFNMRAKTYSQLYSSEKSGAAFSFNKRLRIASALAEPYQGKLLDCASGTGEIAAELISSGRYESAVVNDISAEMLKIARANIESVQATSFVEYLNRSAFELNKSVAPHSCSLVLCLGLIAHTGRLQQLLSVIASLLEVQGAVLLQTSLKTHPGNCTVRWMSHHRHTRLHGYELSYFSGNDIKRAAFSAGLRVDAVRKFGVGIPFGDRISKSLNYAIEQALSCVISPLGSDAIYRLVKQ